MSSIINYFYFPERRNNYKLFTIIGLTVGTYFGYGVAKLFADT